MTYISVDPGTNGAISVIDEDLKVIEIFDMPVRYLKEDEYYKTGKKKKRKDTRKVIDTHTIYLRLSKYAPHATGFVESVTAREGDGKTSSFTFGSMFQGPKSVFECLGIPYYLVTPRRWQTHFGFGKGDTKRQSFETAITYEKESHFTGPRGGVKDGRTDAYLLGRYGASSLSEEKVFWVARFVPSS